MPPKGDSKKTEARRQKVAELYLKGYRQTQIAEKTKVSQGQVSQDLKLLVERWQSQQLTDIDKLKTQELEKINRVEQEANKGWERSLKSATKTKTKNGLTGESAIDITETETQQLVGDPRFLAVIQKCVDQRCKILGIDAPQKVEHSGKVEVKQITGMQVFSSGDPEINEEGKAILINPN